MMTAEDMNARPIPPEKTLDALLPSRFLTPEQLISWNKTEIIVTITQVAEEEIKHKSRGAIWRPVIYFAIRDELDHPQAYLLLDRADREALKSATGAQVIGDLAGKKVKIKISITGNCAKLKIDPSPVGIEAYSESDSGGQEENTHLDEAQITTIAQELRQPLSSILGYTDLLLGESMGILGNLQRKFLNRIRTSTERMDLLILHLLRLTSTGDGSDPNFAETTTLADALDSAMAQTSEDINRKNIVLRTDVNAAHLEVITHSQLKEVLADLIRYVSALTAVEGGIHLRGRIDRDEDMGNFILLEIFSIGGVFPSEDLNAIILGDFGSGVALDGKQGNLARAKDQVESLGGRMWVDSGSEDGFSLSILLPILTSHESTGREEPSE